MVQPNFGPVHRECAAGLNGQENIRGSLFNCCEAIMTDAQDKINFRSIFKA